MLERLAIVHRGLRRIQRYMKTNTIKESLTDRQIFVLYDLTEKRCRWRTVATPEASLLLTSLSTNEERTALSDTTSKKCTCSIDPISRKLMFRESISVFERTRALRHVSKAVLIRQLSHEDASRWFCIVRDYTSCL